MCALRTSSDWPLEMPGSHNSESIADDSPSSDQPQIFPGTSAENNSGKGRKMVRKFNHNASERHDRRRLSSLCSSLRSLLPPADETKKLSIPATVSLVVKYIPELEEEVQRLIQKKEQLLSRISRQAKQIHQEPRSVVVSAHQPSNKELIIQICTYDEVKTPLSNILDNLEKDGQLKLQNVNSFQSSEGRIFHNLYFQVDSSYILEPEALRKKL